MSTPWRTAGRPTGGSDQDRRYCRPLWMAVFALLGAVLGGFLGFVVGYVVTVLTAPSAAGELIRIVDGLRGGVTGVAIGAAVAAPLACWAVLRRVGCVRAAETGAWIAAVLLPSFAASTLLINSGVGRRAQGVSISVWVATFVVVPAVAAAVRTLVARR